MSACWCRHGWTAHEATGCRVCRFTSGPRLIDWRHSHRPIHTLPATRPNDRWHREQAA